MPASRPVAAAPLLVVLLVGCLAPADCGFAPDAVTWTEPGFDARLPEAASPWSVRVLDAPPGIPHDEPTLTAWNATVQEVSRFHQEFGDLRLPVDGDLSLRLVYIDLVGVPEGLRAKVVGSLSKLTDGNEIERGRWADALLADPVEEVLVDDSPGPVLRELRFQTMLPPERVHVGALVAGHVPENRTASLEAAGWRLSLAFPVVEATQGDDRFTADAFGENSYVAPWGETTHEDLWRRFEAAHQSLGLGPAPDAFTFVGIECR